MKQRRLAFVSFLLIAVLVMGVAYAAYTNNLFIKGEASVGVMGAQNAFRDDVYFDQVGSGVVNTTGSNPTSGAEVDSITVGQTDPDSMTFKIYSLATADQYIIFSAVIRNDSDEFDAVVTLDNGQPVVTGTDATKFSIAYSVDQTFPSDPANTTITCPAGGSVTVYVKVTLLQSPHEGAFSAAFNVNLTATSTPKANNA